MAFAHGKYSLSYIYDCFVNIRIYSIHCVIYLNYSNWDFVIHLCLHQTMRKFRVQLYLLILAFLFQLKRLSNSIFFSRVSSNFLDGHPYVRKANWATIYSNNHGPHIEFNILCWGRSQYRDIHKITTLQKRAVRYIANQV